MFPVLMLVIVLIQMLSDTTRAGQALQAVANRAARVAALCCYRIDGAGGATATVRAGESNRHGARNRIHCNNNLAADANVVFIDAAGAEAAAGAVPPGGTAYVFSTRRIPPQVIGGFGLPFIDAERLLAGAVTIDPFRSAPGPLCHTAGRWHQGWPPVSREAHRATGYDPATSQ